MAGIGMEELTVQPELVWEHFTIRDGLPDMKIECIYEDSRGLIWVGTHEGGVASYDGHMFTTYNTENGLAGNGVFSAIEDDSGNMWFGTNRGLSRFDGEKFETLLLDGEARSFLWGRCKDQKGRLWFGLEREPGRDPAICCWDGVSLQAVVLAELDERDEYVGESINAMDVDEKGRIWCGGSRLYVYEVEKSKTQYNWYKITYKKRSYSSDISSIICTVDKVVIGFHHGYALYQNIEGNIGIPEEAIFEKSIEVNDLLYDQKNNDYYALLGSGCIELITENKERENIQKNKGRFWKGYIGSDKQLVWIGTYGMGLYRLSRDKIYLYRDFNNIQSMTVDLKKRLFVFYQNGIVRQDIINGRYFKIDVQISDNMSVSEQGKILHVTNQELQEFRAQLPDLGRVVCCCLVNLQTDCLIVGTLFGHIYVINKSYKVIKVFITQNDGHRINSLQIDSMGRIWYMSKYGKGYGFIDLDKDIFLNRNVVALCPGIGGGVYIAEIINDKTHFTYVGELSEDELFLGNLTDVDVRDLCCTIDGLFIGTNIGLFQLYDGKFTHYTIEDGLSCNIITVIKNFADGFIWFGTEGGGVCCFDGEVFQNIQIGREIDLNIIHDVFEGADNKLWFSTEAGVVNFKKDKSTPSVKITKINEDLFRNDSGYEFPRSTKSIVFSYVGSSIEGDSQGLVYLYRLNRISKKWIQTQEKSIEFKSLSPGNYEFEVIAVNANLVYSEIAKCKVTITADPWLTALNSEALGKQLFRSQDLFKGKILIVDIDQIFVEYSTKFLQGFGYEVTSHTNTEAVGRWSDFDVIIISAYDFKKLDAINKKRNSKELSRFILTVEFNDLGSIDGIIGCRHIAKPFEGYVLFENVQQVLYGQKDELLIYIRNNLKKINKREDVSDAFGVSPNTVSNRVRKGCDMGFSEFLQVCRVQEAQKMLVQTNLNVHQIAFNTGFISHEGLTRTFKKHTGYTPQDFRKKMKSIQK